MAYFCGFYRVFVELPPLARRPTLPDARMRTTAEALLSLQPYVSNWYLQINMSAKQQNREPAKHYVSKTTKQCVNTTAKQQNRKTQTSVSQYFSQYFSQSVLQSVSTSVSQSAFLNKTPPDLPFFVDFVPDVGFGNGWFASSDWPANKRERDVIFDPFLSPRDIICFGTQQAVFSVTRNRFRNRKQLARKGVENSSEVVVFYRSHRGPTRNLAGEGFSRPLRQKTGKIRPFWRGKVAVYRPNQTSKQLVFNRFSAVKDAKFWIKFTDLDVL